MTVSATSNSGESSGSAPLQVDGLISGINTSAVITALLQGYSQPITALQNQQSSLNATASDYQTLVGDMQAVTSAASALDTASKWNLMTASSSNADVAAAVAASGAQAGSMNFTVNNLAQANLLLSTGSVVSQGSTVTSAASFLLATGSSALGLDALSSSSLSLGSHAIQVTQSSAAATSLGSPLADATVITSGSNDTLDLSVNGSAYVLTLAAGSYNPTQLAAAVNAAASVASAPVSASVNASGELSLATAEQGSAATLGVTGGSAEGSLGLSNSESSGANAVVDVDGTSTTLTAITAGQSVTLNAPSGTITANIGDTPTASGALVASGSAQAVQVATGGGTLSGVIQAINNSGLGVTASAVEPSGGQYRLQVGANATGLAGSVSIDPDVFSGSALGGLSQITSAQDASVSIGGVGGYTLTSSNDTFGSILQGTTVTVASAGTATVTVTPDASAAAAQVSALVSAANQALSDINSLTAYNSSTKSGGPLMGAPQVSSLQQKILSLFAVSAGASTEGNSQAAGISVNSNGTLTFNQAKFEQAFATNPSGISALFTQGGTFSPSTSAYAGQVALAFAGATSLPGSYDVSISQSASQASEVGSTFASGSVATAEDLTITAGGTTASYATAAGESLANIAAGMNSVFAANGLALTASVVNNGEQLQLTANNFGSLANFTISSDTSGSGTTGLGGAANVPATYAGLDVAGSIDGVAATGTGQVLAAPTTDTTLNGLALAVTTSGITSSTDLGTYAYTPGIAQQLETLASQMTASGTGALSSEVTGLQSEATGLNSQITNYQSLESSQQTLLEQEFATMETTLGSLKNESSSITSELSGITANGA